MSQQQRQLGLMTQEIPEFGDKVAGVQYVLRPGGYAVIRNTAGAIAVALTPSGFVLPGGGQDDGETPEEAAVREALEEVGLCITVCCPLGIADELVYAANEATYYRKRCTFFSAALVGYDGGGEADHRLLWMPPPHVLVVLRFRSQRWAVSEACRLMRE
jgi:8-oxo-dGTP pyrophosphatase MutT (NUDIX family)